MRGFVVGILPIGFDFLGVGRKLDVWAERARLGSWDAMFASREGDGREVG